MAKKIVQNLLTNNAVKWPALLFHIQAILCILLSYQVIYNTHFYATVYNISAASFTAIFKSSEFSILHEIIFQQFPMLLLV